MEDLIEVDVVEAAVEIEEVDLLTEEEIEVDDLHLMVGTEEEALLEEDSALIVAVHLKEEIREVEAEEVVEVASLVEVDLEERAEDDRMISYKN